MWHTPGTPAFRREAEVSMVRMRGLGQRPSLKETKGESAEGRILLKNKTPKAFRTNTQGLSQTGPISQFVSCL